MTEATQATRTSQATEATRRANETLLGTLPFDDVADEHASGRGFIAPLPDLVFVQGTDIPSWDAHAFDFIDGDAPDTVNPSLWRQERLNRTGGLFEVADGIYQVRNLDLATMSFIRGETGWIVVDPLTRAETAAVGLELVQAHVERLPVSAVIYTHSHADHFGGVRGVVDQQDVDAGRVRIIAPVGFTEEAVSENVMAGTAMSRRATYMYGMLLPASPTGMVGSGLGKTTANGNFGLLEPTDHIGPESDSLVLDGVEVQTLYTPDTEAPAEFVFFLPGWGALCTAEIVTHTLHNLYTLRGAQVRDALAWAKSIDAVLARWGDRTELIFASHHWPTWGAEACRELLAAQRDGYRYLHDETLRLINHGQTMLEIAEEVALPPSLADVWSLRGYYGSVNHDVKAVYQRYLGFFDGNPANLHPHPPTEAARRYVDYMGGADAVIARARQDHDVGDDRWVAEVLNHVVFADPDNLEARELLAEAYTQLGYQAESGPWRNFYLTGAKELRDGVVAPAGNVTTVTPDIIAAMDTSLILDFVSVRLRHAELADLRTTVLLELTDVEQRFVLELSNGVLHHRAVPGDPPPGVDATVTMSRARLNQLLGEVDVAALLAETDVEIDGNAGTFETLLEHLDDFGLWFDIVTP
jgi:alkyl sulfatase BDS1-like metallo-beta-lactamase superfamily hydrolase